MTSPAADATPRDIVLHLRGDVDFFTEDGFRAEAEKLLADDDAGRFVVDLAEVGMVDSSGLSLLVDLLRLCREMGLTMIVRDVPERVQQLLDLTGLDQVIASERSADT
ncbi:MAG TPA: STAS domain-containing protein [Jatrophihabitantaceae bacterium]|jgi:anti-sigma B factor antagonist|nr:STAS domain-containing protein [Jatrophihabitantaceae bacterium]